MQTTQQQAFFHDPRKKRAVCAYGHFQHQQEVYKIRKPKRSLIDNDVTEATRKEDTVTNWVNQIHSLVPNWLSENSVVITKVTVV